jgi:hypothetical protein
MESVVEIETDVKISDVDSNLPNTILPQLIIQSESICMEIGVYLPNKSLRFLAFEVSHQIYFS